MTEQPACVIDVGSNTVRMLVGAVRDNQLRRLCYRQQTTRLAAGLTDAGCLQAVPVNRTIEAVSRQLNTAERFSPERTVIVATEAIRSAANGLEFVHRLRALTGHEVRVIDWQTEARLGCLGALQSLVLPEEVTMYFDLGGGSLEIAIAHGTRLLEAVSLPVGVVRLKERPVSGHHLRTALAGGLENVLAGRDAVRLIGTAGTVTTLAAVHLGLRAYQPGLVNGTILHRRDLLAARERLAPLAPAEREAVPGMEPGRGDLILHGLDVVLTLMELSGFDRLVVADGGLLEGVLLDATMFH